tara:strand:+ start:153 stop:464 length:312 start_codon:yes stop_codon:yes gene_type:complete
MNQKMNRLRTQEMELHNYINWLTKIKKIMLWIAFMGIITWTSVAIIDFSKAMDLLWIEGINLFLIAIIILMDWEIESSQIACDKKRIQLKETVLINRIKHGID